MDKLKKIDLNIIPKWWSIVVWILIGLFVLLQPLNGQIVKVLPEIVPYRLIPSGDNFCHMEIEIIEPQSFRYMVEIQKEEMKKTI